MSRGCFNREPFDTSTTVQDGWHLVAWGADGFTRTPNMVEVPFRMEPTCQFTHTELGQADKRCDGCKWRATA